MSNNELERQVSDELLWDPKIDNSAIAVSANDGVVSLRGTVASFRQKREAQKDANRFLNEAASLEQNLDLMQSREEVLANLKKSNLKVAANIMSADGPSVTYHLANKLTVPSRNDEQVIEVVK